MSEIGEMYLAIRELKKAKKAERLEQARILFDSMPNLDYRILSRCHWRLCTDPEIDVWPTTWTWKVRGDARCRYGRDALVRYLQSKGEI